MTVLCIAMGTPMPTISLYISGRLVRQETTRHMVTVIHNVTKDMDQISCYADNGYGTPMQASKKITISRKWKKYKTCVFVIQIIYFVSSKLHQNFNTISGIKRQK